MDQICYGFLVNENGENYEAKIFAYEIGAFNYNWHPYVEFLFVVKGAMEVSIDGTIYQLSEDDMCFINTSVGHATLSKEVNTTAIALQFDPNLYKNHISDKKVIKFINSYIDKDNKVCKHIRKNVILLIDSFNEQDCLYKIKRKVAFYNIIYQVLENFSLLEVKDEYIVKPNIEAKLVDKMVLYLEDNYKNKIYLEDLSELIGYHPNYVSEVFSKLVGMPFTEYLKRYRLTKATKELKDKSKTISEIALNNGFSNVRSFNTYFKEVFNRTPSSYRIYLDNRIKEVDKEFKKNFLSRDSKLWIKVRERWSNKRDSSIRVDFIEIEKEIRKQVIEEIIEKIKE